MIHLVIPSKRKPTTPSWVDKYKPTKTKHINSSDMAVFDSKDCVGEYFTQVLKRNAILQELLKGCTAKVGDIVTPRDPKELEAMGELCVIEAVYDNITNLEPEWPKDNKPYTMKFKSQKTGKSFYCNPLYYKSRIPYQIWLTLFLMLAKYQVKLFSLG